MNIGDVVFWAVMAVAAYTLFGPLIKDLLVLAWKGAIYALTDQWAHRLAAQALPEPKTDDNGYILNPILAEQIQALEEDCQTGEYAPGQPKYKCNHEWVDGACFWCSKAEASSHVHSKRCPPRCGTTHGFLDLVHAFTDGNAAVEALEIALEEPSSDTNRDRAISISMEFISNGQARLVKAALKHVGVTRVVNLREDQVEPFIQRLLYESMRPQTRLQNPGQKKFR